MQRLPLLLCALLCAVTFIHCSPPPALLFHAGVGQRSSLREIQAEFTRMHPQARINFSFKGSGYFIADISRSHEGDLYLPGEEFYLLQAVERGFIREYDPERDIAAYFTTVILTPRGNPKNIRNIHDFARPGIRVGLGNPKACAIGIVHEKVFTKAGIGEAVRRNAAFSAKCIPELGNAAQHRLIDATIVWAPTAVLYLRDCEIVPLAAEYRSVIRLPVARLKFSRNPELAERLKDFILSDRGREIFQKHAYAVGGIKEDGEGFLRPEDTSTDALMRWLVNAAAAVKNSSREVTADSVGPLMQEVLRQRKTTRAGD